MVRFPPHPSMFNEILYNKLCKFSKVWSSQKFGGPDKTICNSVSLHYGHLNLMFNYSNGYSSIYVSNYSNVYDVFIIYIVDRGTIRYTRIAKAVVEISKIVDEEDFNLLYGWLDNIINRIEVVTDRCPCRC